MPRVPDEHECLRDADWSVAIVDGERGEGCPCVVIGQFPVIGATPLSQQPTTTEMLYHRISPCYLMGRPLLTNCG